MKHLFFSLLITFCLIFTACKNMQNSPEEDSICITLPSWPPKQDGADNYPPLSRWQINIYSAEHQQVFYTYKDSIMVNTKKNRPFCITAQPITFLQNGYECAYFKPAGYLYPFSSENKATWEQGYLSFTMSMIFKEAFDDCLSPVDIEYFISTFNWKKAQSSIETKIYSDSELFYNPWLIPYSKLIESISSGTFKASVLNLTGSVPLDLNFLNNYIGKQSNMLLSSFIPENHTLHQKKQFTVMKNSPILIADSNCFGLFINYKSSKNISLEFIYLPIYIEDI